MFFYNKSTVNLPQLEYFTLSFSERVFRLTRLSHGSSETSAGWGPMLSGAYSPRPFGLDGLFAGSADGTHHRGHPSATVGIGGEAQRSSVVCPRRWSRKAWVVPSRCRWCNTAAFLPRGAGSGQHGKGLADELESMGCSVRMLSRHLYMTARRQDTLNPSFSNLLLSPPWVGLRSTSRVCTETPEVRQSLIQGHGELPKPTMI